MELDNDTGVPAILYRTVIDQHRMASALVARITYRIEPGGKLVRDGEQPWSVSKGPWEGPAGPMHPDEIFLRGGVDLFVFGQAWAPGGNPTTKMSFRVAVGKSFSSEVMVTGDRVWTGRGESLTPSSPKPFISIPLTLANAFGGKTRWDGLEVPYVSNPEGKGYSLEAKAALDLPLPNLEDPEAPMRQWNDIPDPVGVGVRPSAFGPHLRESVIFGDDGVLKELKPTFFNHAFPRMVVPKVAPGETVTITGASPDGPVQLVMPNAALLMDLSIGRARLERPLAIDQVGIEVERRRAFVTYRYPFRYTIVPREIRSCRLRLARGSA